MATIEPFNGYPNNEAVRWNGDRQGPYIRLRNGQKYYLSDPRPEDFQDVEDLAYSLSGIYRYTGGSRISVAQHMVVGSRMAERFYPDNALLPARFLIHDVTEARLGDMSSPLKALCPDYKVLEDKTELAVEARFNLQYLGVPEVKELDYRMWLTERLVVFPNLTKADDYSGPLEPFPLTSAELEDELGLESGGPAYWEAEWLWALRKHLPWVQW